MSTVLIVAKAPVTGRVKTRLSTAYSFEDAARLASAALLDTLDAAQAVPGARCAVALTGELDDAVDADSIRAALAECTVFAQTGEGLAARLVHAHREVAGRFGGPVLQIGMDTPQVDSALLAAGLRAAEGAAALGPAEDGGWWALGLPDGAAARLDPLLTVPMSMPETGVETRAALVRAGLGPVDLPTLRDVDRPADVAVVAAACAPGSRFRRRAAEVRPSFGSDA